MEKSELNKLKAKVYDLILERDRLRLKVDTLNREIQKLTLEIENPKEKKE